MKQYKIREFANGQFEVIEITKTGMELSVCFVSSLKEAHKVADKLKRQSEGWKIVRVHDA